MDDVYETPCRYIRSLPIFTTILLAIVYGLRQWGISIHQSKNIAMLFGLVGACLVTLVLGIVLTFLSTVWLDRLGKKLKDIASNTNDTRVRFALLFIMSLDLFLLLPIALLAIMRPDRIILPTFLSMTLTILVRYAILSTLLACTVTPSSLTLKRALNVSTVVSILLITTSIVEYVLKRRGEYGVAWDGGDTASMVFTVLPLFIWGGMIRV